MNIFYLDNDPMECAKQVAYRHTVKMIVESIQMLSTAHHELDGKDVPEGLMKTTHKNHPDNVWLRNSVEHYEWLLDYTKALMAIYTVKSGKVHKCVERLEAVSQAPKNMPSNGFVEPPKCVDDEFKHLSTVKAYQKYLKKKYQEWLARPKPLTVQFVFDTPHWME